MFFALLADLLKLHESGHGRCLLRWVGVSRESGIAGRPWALVVDDAGYGFDRGRRLAVRGGGSRER